MNSHQRVLKAIDFEKTDRIPLWDVHHYGGFTEKWQNYLGLSSNIEPMDYYGYDTAVFGPDESFFPLEKELLSDDGEYYIENDGFGRITRRKRDGYFPHILEYKLKERKDIDSLSFENPGILSRYEKLDEFIARHINRCRFCRTGGIYIRAHTLWPEDRLLMDMLQEPGFCNDLFDLVTEHMTAMSLESLKKSDFKKTGLWVYDDMANTLSPMFSPKLFEKYLLPRYKKLITKCREAGCRHFFFHSDGNIGPLIDMLIEAGFEGFNPLEPRSGLHLPELRKRYPGTVLFGGVCNTSILQRNDKNEIKDHIKPLLEVAEDGGVVLGMASASDDISPEAYDFYMSLVRR
jgi:uroporphyrinogen decarboxylase